MQSETDPFILEFIVNIRWLVNYVTQRLDPIIERHYPQLMTDATELENVLSHSYASISSLAMVPFGALHVARSGYYYLLLSEAVLGTAPPTMHPFLVKALGGGPAAPSPTHEPNAAPQSSRDGLNSSFRSDLDTRTVGSLSTAELSRHVTKHELQAMTILLRWLSMEGVLPQEELATTLSIPSLKKNASVSSRDSSRSSNTTTAMNSFRQGAERLSMLSPFYLGAHVVITRALLLEYTCTLLPVHNIAEHAQRLSTKYEGMLHTVEDALLLWMRSVVLLVKERESTNVAVAGVPSKQWNAWRAWLHIEKDLYKILHDGIIVCVLLHFYQPQLIAMESVEFPDPYHVTQGGQCGSLSVEQCLYNWNAALRAVQRVGLWPGFTADEIVHHGYTCLQLHLLRFVEELFAALATHAEEEVRASLEIQREREMSNSMQTAHQKPLVDSHSDSQNLVPPSPVVGSRRSSPSRLSAAADSQVSSIVIRAKRRSAPPPAAAANVETELKPLRPLYRRGSDDVAPLGNQGTGSSLRSELHSNNKNHSDREVLMANHVDVDGSTLTEDDNKAKDRVLQASLDDRSGIVVSPPPVRPSAAHSSLFHSSAPSGDQMSSTSSDEEEEEFHLETVANTQQQEEEQAIGGDTFLESSSVTKTLNTTSYTTTKNHVDASGTVVSESTVSGSVNKSLDVASHNNQSEPSVFANHMANEDMVEGSEQELIDLLQQQRDRSCEMPRRQSSAAGCDESSTYTSMSFTIHEASKQGSHVAHRLHPLAVVDSVQDDVSPTVTHPEATALDSVITETTEQVIISPASKRDDDDVLSLMERGDEDDVAVGAVSVYELVSPLDVTPERASETVFDRTPVCQSTQPDADAGSGGGGGYRKEDNISPIEGSLAASRLGLGGNPGDEDSWFSSVSRPGQKPSLDDDDIRDLMRHVLATNATSTPNAGGSTALLEETVLKQQEIIRKMAAKLLRSADRQEQEDQVSPPRASTNSSPKRRVTFKDRKDSLSPPKMEGDDKGQKRKDHNQQPGNKQYTADEIDRLCTAFVGQSGGSVVTGIFSSQCSQTMLSDHTAAETDISSCLDDRLIDSMTTS